MTKKILSAAKFILEDTEEAFDRGFDDSAWEEVNLPHDWAVEHEFDEKNSSGTAYLPGGIGWYRIHFNLDKEEADRNVILHFDGIYKHSRVFVNGYYMGEWANGYTAFEYDITHALRFGDEENIIAVRVEHTDFADSRWYTGSGIEKTVTLFIQEKLHPSFRDLSFETVEANKEHALVDVSDVVLNNSDKESNTEIVFSLFDKAGKEVAREKTSVLLDKSSGKKVSASLKISNPNLWSDDNPYLYRLLVSVNKDSIERNVGIRIAKFDPDKGFFINGVSKKLKGVCLHEDAGCFGNAVPKSVWERRLKKLKRMGANTIRMSHNPHSAELYDLCDEMGFFVIDEIFDEWEGVKNKWSTGHNVYPPKHQGYYRDYPMWHALDVESFVKENRTRASVIMWSIGNEIDYPNDPYCHQSFTNMTGNNDANKPAKEREYNSNRPNAERLVPLAKDLCSHVREFDTSRPVSLASAFPELSANTGLFEPLDVIGYNYKEHLYEADHKRFPNQPIFGSENGHSLDKWEYVLKNDYISGQCIWTGIDYLGETYRWPLHGSQAGMLTTSGREKADYFFRTALWSEKAFVSFATGFPDTANNYDFGERTWNYKPDSKILVRVYSNAKSVEILVNKKSIVNSDIYYVKDFEIEYVPGEITVKAYPENGNEISDTVFTTGTGTALKIEKYESDNDDIAQFEVSMVDTNGNVVTSDESLLEISVEGDASFIGIDNGNLADTTPYKKPYRRLSHGTMMVYLRKGNRGEGYTLMIHHKLLGNFTYS